MVSNTCGNGSNTCEVDCPAGKKALGGGCAVGQFDRYLFRSVPKWAGEGWMCGTNAAVTSWLTAAALCAKIQ